MRAALRTLPWLLMIPIWGFMVWYLDVWECRHSGLGIFARPEDWKVRKK